MDRCYPEKALEVLESIKSFFDVEGFIYVIGMDSESIDSLIRRKYGAGSNIKGLYYLQKIVQLPFQIPTWKEVDLSKSISKIIENGLEGSKELIDEFEKNKEMIVKAVQLNPREVKRFINNVILAKSVFEKPVDQLIAVRALDFRTEWNKFFELITPDDTRKRFLNVYEMLENEKRSITTEEEFEKFVEERSSADPISKDTAAIYKELIKQGVSLQSFLNAGAAGILLQIEKMEEHRRALETTKHKPKEKIPTMRNAAEDLVDNPPYVGVRPFQRDILEDRARFFGRDQESKQIVSLILSNPLILVYSPPGAGKTSLFNANILSTLESQAFQSLPTVRMQNTLSNADSKNIFILNALQSLNPSADPQTLTEKSLTTFLKEYYPREMSTESIPTRRLIIFDQLEELFSLYSDRLQDQLKDFFRQITEALDDDPLLRIVFIIREEYLSQLDPFAGFVKGRLWPRFRLDYLRKEAALLAIKGPLENTRRSFAPGVAEKLVDDLLKVQVEKISPLTLKQAEVISECVEPILLQAVCLRLWRELPEQITQITQAEMENFWERQVKIIVN